MFPSMAPRPSTSAISYPTRCAIGLEAAALDAAGLLRLVLLLDAIHDAVLLETVEVQISRLPAVRALRAVGSYGGAIGGDLGRGEGCLFG